MCSDNKANVNVAPQPEVWLEQGDASTDAVVVSDHVTEDTLAAAEAVSQN